jgi:hypothetical protein
MYRLARIVVQRSVITVGFVRKEPQVICLQWLYEYEGLRNEEATQTRRWCRASGGILTGMYISHFTREEDYE